MYFCNFSPVPMYVCTFPPIPMYVSTDSLHGMFAALVSLIAMYSCVHYIWLAIELQCVLVVKGLDFHRLQCVRVCIHKFLCSVCFHQLQCVLVCTRSRFLPNPMYFCVHYFLTSISKFILANRPDFIRTVLIFDLQNLRKSGRPDFPEFQPVTILVFKIIFSMSFLCKPRRNLLCRCEPSTKSGVRVHTPP